MMIHTTKKKLTLKLTYFINYDIIKKQLILSDFMQLHILCILFTYYDDQ